jgi:ubiquinol-cytochrome c reductase subunit 7
LLYLKGLRYDDLYDPMYDLDIKEALNRLPREIVDARNQRIKRAMDLSMKHEYLPQDLQVQSLSQSFKPQISASIIITNQIEHAQLLIKTQKSLVCD